MIVLLQLIAVLVCICGEAFFSGMETGIISIRRLRLRHQLRQGDKSARILDYFLDEPDRLLGTTLVGTNLCVVMASVLGASVATRFLGPARGKVASTLVLTVVLLLFAEYIPKAWFHARPYVRSARFARLLRWSWTVFQPIGLSVTWLAGLVIPEEGSAGKDLRSLVNRDELKLLAVEGERHGVFTPAERKMIHRTVEVADKPVKNIMTPLAQVSTVPANATVGEFLELARATEFRRYPLRKPGGNGFSGIVDVFDVLSANADMTDPIQRFATSPVSIRAETPAAQVMPILRLARQSLGLVVDSEHTVIGIITTEDLLLQIVG